MEAIGFVVGLLLLCLGAMVIVALIGVSNDHKHGGE
jgi:hypothetical protein